jgi:hypothetical protein
LAVDGIASALGTPLRATDFDGALSERELEAALMGVDLRVQNGESNGH